MRHFLDDLGKMLCRLYECRISQLDATFHSITHLLYHV